MRETNVDAVKITNQFRSKDGFVYDLRSDGARLTVAIMPREHSADPADWKVEARSSQPSSRRKRQLLGPRGSWL